jgi:hypothetical protein
MMDGGRINLTEYGKGLFTKRTAGVYPPKMRKLLSQVGSQGIHSILVVRTPLSGFVTTLLNAISLGSYDNALKQSPYDKMFHLCLFINGDYILEKNGVVEFRRGDPVKKGTERSDVTNVPLKGKELLTIQQAIDITREKMGNDRFSVYKADSWNCQDFVLGFLEANGLSSDSLKQFILQDPKEIFGRMPQFAKNIGQVLTDTDAVVNKIIEGEGGPPIEGTGMCCMCKRVKVGGSYVMFQNGECWTVLNQSTGRVLAYCTTEEKAKKQIDMLNRMQEQEELEKAYAKDKVDIEKIGDKAHAKVKSESKKIKRSYKKKRKMQETWKEYYSKQTKGKKFANRAEVNAWMKKCSADYKAMKAKAK